MVSKRGSIIQADAIIAGATAVYASGYWGQGADAMRGYTNAISNYNSASGENLDPVALAPVTDIGHYKNGGWVTTNTADLMNQLHTNGAFQNGTENDWFKSENLFNGAIATSWGGKQQLIDYATTFDESINDLKYVKGVRVISKAFFISQVIISGVQVGSAWINSDKDWRTNDGNKWGVTGKAALDITMGYIGLVGGPIGWIVSGGYFLGDMAGLWGKWGDAPK